MKLKNKNNKKAEITGQMVVYILGMIIIGLLLLFGTRVILSTEDRIETIDVTTFRQTLESRVNDLAPNYGSWRVVEINVPSGVEEVYFLDLDFPSDRRRSDKAIVDEIWETESSNVVTIPFTQQSSILLDNIELSNEEGIKSRGWDKFTVVDGKITLKLIGLGNGVRIERQS